MFQEKRVNERFLARDGTCGTFTLPRYSYHLLVGQVLDISRGGFCIKYLSNGDGYRMDESVLVNMFYGDRFINSTRVIPCKVVRDVSVMNSPNGCLSIRKCGLKYYPMTRTQLDDLDRFIDVCSEKMEGKMNPANLSHAIEFGSHSLGA